MSGQRNQVSTIPKPNPPSSREGNSPLPACPFCGGMGDLRDTHHGGEERAYYIVCISCACQGPWAKTPGNAVRFWCMRTEAK